LFGGKCAKDYGRLLGMRVWGVGILRVCGKADCRPDEAGLQTFRIVMGLSRGLRPRLG
jgi:hypothetical protein